MIRPLVTTVAMLLTAAALSACGGDDSGSGTVPAAEATVHVEDVPGYGEALVTRSGEPVFLWTADAEGSSKCDAQCAKTWKPLAASGEPKAGPGTDGGELSTFKRDDGTTQVLYGGHALYTNKDGVLAAGTESGGGTWYLVNADGDAIEETVDGGY